MIYRVAALIVLIAVCRSAGAAGIENTSTSHTWEVVYARNDNIPGYSHANKQDLVLRVQIRKTGMGSAPSNYTVNIRRFDRVQGGNYVLRTLGGSFNNVAVADIQGNPSGRKRMALKTDPQSYMAADGTMHQVWIVAIWHTGKVKNPMTSRADDRLNVRLFDVEASKVAQIKEGFNCPEEPDTDVLEEQPAMDLNTPPPVDDEGP